MSTLVADCPRCHSKNMTFDLRDVLIVDERYSWQRIYEMPCICRHCHRFTTFVASQSHIQHSDQLREPGFLRKYDGSANDYIDVTGFISLKDNAGVSPPEDLDNEIKGLFIEGATSLIVGCPNAAAAMFRACIDNATRGLLPDGEANGLNPKVRRDLGLRLPWLFERNLLAKDLQELSRCIREDGNDGVHVGNLKRDDAEDLLDFTLALLDRLVSEPARLKVAQLRRDERRKPKK